MILLHFHGKWDSANVWIQNHKIWTEEKHMQEYLPQLLNRNFIIISHLILKKIFLKVIILMPDSPQGDGYRQTTHPQPIYNVVICNVNSVCCLYHAKSFKNIRFCDTVIVETMLVMKIIQHFSCHMTITLKAVCTIDLYTTIKNSKN